VIRASSINAANMVEIGMGTSARDEGVRCFALITLSNGQSWANCNDFKLSKCKQEILAAFCKVEML